MPRCLIYHILSWIDKTFLDHRWYWFCHTVVEGRFFEPCWAAETLREIEAEQLAFMARWFDRIAAAEAAYEDELAAIEQMPEYTMAFGDSPIGLEIIRYKVYLQERDKHSTDGEADE